MLRDLYERFEQNTPQYRLGLWKSVWASDCAKRLFAPLEDLHFTHTVPSDAERIWLRILSKSYIACQAPDVQAQLKHDVTAVLREFFPADVVAEIAYPYTTDLFFARCL